MIQANIILETRRKSSNGYAIKIEVYSNRKYKYISLNKFQKNKTLKIDTDLARRIAQLDNEVKYCNENNISIEESIEIIKNGIPNDNDLEIFLLKKKLAELQKISGIGFVEFFAIRIDELKELSHSIRAYEQTKIQIEIFLHSCSQEDVLINEIDYEWLHKFIRFKKITTKKGKGGVNFYLRTMRAAYKEAQKRDSLNIKKDNPFLGVIKSESKKDIIDIPIEYIKKLKSLISTYNSFLNENKKIEGNKGMTKKNAYLRIRAIEIWLFQIAIGGVDFVDISQLTWDNIKTERIVFKRYKNRNKPDGGATIDNMLSVFSNYIIKKYGDKKSDRIFSFIPDASTKKYIIFRDNISDILYRISNTLNFKERIRTKSPRYIFRSFAGELLIDTLVIMQLQGHKPEGVTYRYQKKLPHKIVDKEHQKILDLIGV